MDSEERFNNNMSDPTSAQELSRIGLTADCITYKFNSDGYRCNQDFITDSDSVMFLGCSLTAGIGVPNHATWAYQVAEHLGLTCYNLGWPGGSPDTVFRVGQYWIPLLKPKHVVCLWPEQARREVFNLSGLQQLNPGVDFDNQYYTAWLSDDRNFYYQFLRNCLALEYVCDSQNTTLLQFNSDSICQDGFARDLAHPGIAAHYQFAKKVINDLENS